MKVIKRNGKEVEFDPRKIRSAIERASKEVYKLSPGFPQVIDIDYVTECVVDQVEDFKREVNVEEIQEIVEETLMSHEYFDIAKAYIRYRYDHKLKREQSSLDGYILSIVENTNEDAKQENSNKNTQIIPTQRDYIAGAVSKDMSRRLLMKPEWMNAHDKGMIHIHDLDYFVQKMHNCDLVNLEDMLQNGTVISGTKIDKPHTFSTAATITTQIIAQVASNQYGGQSISLAHLAPFVEATRKKLTLENMDIYSYLSPERFDQHIEKLVREDIKRGVQTLQYQLITLMTTNGQAPFVTFYMDINEARNEYEREDLALIIEEVLRQRIQGVKNESDVWITPAFPKLIYALDENNIHEDSRYFYLTKLSAECTAKRMVPDYISNKIERELKKGDTYTCMGCRSFLTPDRTTENYAHALNYIPQMGKYYGRFNQGVVTINLPYLALMANKDIDRFWEIFDDVTEDLCYPILMARHNRLLGTPSDVAPILWQHGALARLKKGETIDELLYHGYSTISLGYAGLYECTYAMTGASHTSPEGKDFALDVMRALNNKCAKWKAETDIDFSLYGTPIESTTYKFAKALQKDFGKIPGVSDKNYITNSYHVHVTEEIDAFTKLSFESEFQELSPGGAISYVEVPNMQNNIPAVLTVIKYIYDHIMYAELNTKSDYCMECGYDGEIKIVEEDHKLLWECPNCGNRDQNKMSVARRTCGYIGSQFWNQGRTQEIRDRVLHL